MDDNKRIQSFWYGSQLSDMEKLCIKSFLSNDHEFHLYSYDEISIPKGCILLDANEIVEKKKVFFDSRGGIAGFSDYFRIQLLYKRGGWWVDMDMICLKYFNFPEAYCFCSEYNRDNIILVGSGCIKSPKKAEYLKDYTNFMDKYLETKEVVEWGDFGPKLLRFILSHYDANKFIQPPFTFCPVNWFNFRRLITSSGEKIDARACAVHMFNEMWRLNKVDKTSLYKGSIYEKLRERYF